MIRQAALDAGVPFLNIVQACTWAPSDARAERRRDAIAGLHHAGLRRAGHLLLRLLLPGHQGGHGPRRRHAHAAVSRR